MNNKFQDLNVGDILEDRQGTKYEVTGFMLHLDTIVVKVRNLESGKEVNHRGQGFSKILPPERI